MQDDTLQICSRLPIAVLLIALTSFGTGCLSAIYASGKRAENTQWVDSIQARIAIAGTLIDQDGQPLEDVDVRIDCIYLSPGWEGLPDVKERMVTRSTRVNRRFRFNFSKVWTVHVTFDKPGYQSTTLDFTTASNIDPHRDLYVKRAEGRDVASEEITVILSR